MEIVQSAWNELNRGVVRSKYETEGETVDHWHAQGGGLFPDDWLENEKKTELDYKRDVCDALMVSRPWKWLK